MKFHPEDLSSLVLRARNRKGYSQLFMAQRLGISQKTYSYIEAGHCNPDIIKFLKICIVTETHPMQVLEKLIEGKPPWDSIEMKEDKLTCEIDKNKAEITYLKSQNLFLQGTINKLLELQKTKNEQLSTY
jgi:transcriptional regulator with XRE-family HTH domain